MKKSLVAAVAASAAMFALSACDEHRTTDLPPGRYEHSSSSTDSNGTTHEHHRTTDVSEDANGNKTAVVRSQNSNDPRGLFNKTSTDDTQVIQDNRY